MLLPRSGSRARKRGAWRRGSKCCCWRAPASAKSRKRRSVAKAKARCDGIDGLRKASEVSSHATSAHDEKLALAPALWLDPDVRWLCGVHEAEGHVYLIREQYEELLWWLLMPSLLRLAGEAAPSRVAVAELSETVAAALASAEAAGYRIDVMLGTGKVAAAGEPPKSAPEKACENEAATEARSQTEKVGLAPDIRTDAMIPGLLRDPSLTPICPNGPGPVE